MIDDLKKRGFKGLLLKNESLKDKTFYQIGGQAKYFVLPKDTTDLSLLSQLYQKEKFSYFVLGLGSNLLIKSDTIIDKVFISLKDFSQSYSLTNVLRVDAQMSIRKLLKIARTEGLQGFEFLAGIPGNVGGSIFMNAGTHLGEICELLNSFTLFDLKTGREEKVEKKDFDFAYRKNHKVKEGQIIIAADFIVKRGNALNVQEKIYQSLVRRKEGQPLDLPSCGSVFKNPPGSKAWELIDQVGLRGHQIGQAQISFKHPNWIVNLGGASSDDVLSLIQLVQEKVKAQSGIELLCEVQYVD